MGLFHSLFARFIRLVIFNGVCMGSNFANIVMRLFKIGIRRNCVQVLPCGGNYPKLIATLIVIHNSIAIAG